MQQNLHAFLGISDSDSEPAASQNLHLDQLKKGNHYWTGLKTAEELTEPGKSDYDILDEILALQQTPEYADVADEGKLEYVFDPDKFGKKDLTLTTDNYKLETEELLAYGKLATSLRLKLLEQSEDLQKQSESELQP